MAGFAIEPDGNLVSVFSLNPTDKKGFLHAIKSFIKEQGANKLDCFISKAQPLKIIYEKTLGFKAASILDFNYEVLAESKGKEYADNFVKTHGEAQVAFMVLNDNEVPERHFSKDEYDQAKEYQISQAEKRDNGQTLYQPAAGGEQPSLPAIKGTAGEFRREDYAWAFRKTGDNRYAISKINSVIGSLMKELQKRKIDPETKERITRTLRSAIGYKGYLYLL
ncbi:MAG: hypothetical protein K5838_08620 [Elusimicrobiales bacterium]|nr:hypothetical protein [Elusimicrobiales bacterium]